MESSRLLRKRRAPSRATLRRVKPRRGERLVELVRPGQPVGEAWPVSLGMCSEWGRVGS